VEEISTLYQQMHKSQHRNTKNMINHGNMSPPKVHNSLAVDSRDSEVDDIWDKEFKRMIF
jgi:hypothetical protein